MFYVKLVIFGGKFSGFEEEREVLQDFFPILKFSTHIKELKTTKKQKFRVREDETGDNNKISSEELHKGKEAGGFFPEAQFIKHLINYVNLCRLHQQFNGCINHRICYYALVEIK